MLWAWKKYVQTQISQSPRRWVGAWQRGKGGLRRRWGNLKVTLQPAHLQVRDLQDKVKDLQELVRGLQVQNRSFSCHENSASLTNLIVDCRQLEGDHGHRCWPSGAAVLYLGTVFLNPIDFIHESIPIHPIMWRSPSDLLSTSAAFGDPWTILMWYFNVKYLHFQTCTYDLNANKYLWILILRQPWNTRSIRNLLV